MTEYEVIRFSQNGRQRLIKGGVSLSEAQKICSDPETSSMTATAPRGCKQRNSNMINQAKVQRWHDLNKHWFYGYREAKN